MSQPPTPPTPTTNRSSAYGANWSNSDGLLNQLLKRLQLQGRTIAANPMTPAVPTPSTALLLIQQRLEPANRQQHYQRQQPKERYNAYGANFSNSDGLRNKLLRRKQLQGCTIATNRITPAAPTPSTALLPIQLRLERENTYTVGYDTNIAESVVRYRESRPTWVQNLAYS